MLESALQYQALDYAVFPCAVGGKRPLTASGFKEATADAVALRQWWQATPHANIGLPTAGLVVIDVDGPDNAWSGAFDDSDCPLSLTPRGGRHFFFRKVDDLAALRCSAGKLAQAVDIRTDGGYVCVARSVVDGQPYKWQRPLRRIAELPEPPAWLVRELLDKCIAQPAPAPPGPQRLSPMPDDDSDLLRRAALYLDAMPAAISGSGGHNATFDAACRLVNGFALSTDQAVDLLWRHYNPRCEPPWSEREIRHKVDSAARAQHTEPRGALRDARNDAGLPAVDLSGFDASNPPQPAALDFQPIPVDALPEPIRSFVIDASNAIGCDASMVALPMLASLAAAVGNTRRIELKSGWLEPSVLWSGIVCESGQHKTPAVDAATTFLEREELPETRHIISDVTREALAGLLALYPRGLLLVRDELAGWLNFGEYKSAKGGDVAFWLSLHSAKPLRVDRKAKNPQTGQQDATFVPVASCSLTGGIQPGALQRALGPEFFDNGLAARLLLAYPPKRPRRWSNATIQTSVTEKVQAVFRRLTELEFAGDLGGAIDIPLTPAAQAAFIRFYNEHGAEMTNLSANAAALWSKLEGGAARLALVIHLVRVAADDKTLASADAVDERSIDAGVTLANWFGAEGLRIYDLLGQQGDGDGDGIDYKLLEWIKGRGGNVTARDVRKGCRRLRGEGVAEKALIGLQKAGYGSWRVVATGGRPAHEFVAL